MRPPFEVDGGERLEDVVELRGGEVDGDGLVAGDAAGVLEEADAILVERDPGDGKLRGDGGVGAGSRGLRDGSHDGLDVGLRVCNERDCKKEGEDADCLAHTGEFLPAGRCLVA